jgi:hypothetical protein
MEEVAGDDPEGREAVDDAAPEADRAGLGEVAGRHRDLADPVAQTGGDDLGDELLVEDEVVAVEVIGDPLQEPPAVGPETGGPKTRFSMTVRNRLLMYFQRGIPPASGSPRNRLPSIRSARSARIGSTRAGIRVASYW